MSSIDFENGLMIGLAIAYKKAAALVTIGDFMFIGVADTLMLHVMAMSDALTATLPHDERPSPVADSTSLPIVSVSDAVSATLI